MQRVDMAKQVCRVPFSLRFGDIIVCGTFEWFDSTFATIKDKRI
jgi:hypothetical protein